MFQIVVKEYHGAGILAAGFGCELRVVASGESFVLSFLTSEEQLSRIRF